jgi:hypothetical protein
MGDIRAIGTLLRPLNQKICKRLGALALDEGGKAHTNHDSATPILSYRILSPHLVGVERSIIKPATHSPGFRWTASSEMDRNANATQYP